MPEIVLVDAQPARVRLFREAAALSDDWMLVKKKVAHLRRQAFTTRQQAFAARVRARQQIERAGRMLRLHVFPNSAEALRFLQREEPYAWAPSPAVVFTDLYLEGGGLAFVERLKADPALRQIPAIMLCSGASAVDMRAAWEAGSNAVLDLPTSKEEGFQRVRDALRFWLSEAATPS